MAASTVSASSSAGAAPAWPQCRSSAWIRRAWQRLPVLSRYKRGFALVAAVPVIWYGCVSAAPSLPDRVQAALTPLRSAVFNYHYGQHKRALFSSLRGDVLELGAADGSNFAFLPPHLVYSAIEPNAHQLSFLADNAASAGYPAGTVALSNGDVAQTLQSLPDDSRDAVIACLVLSRQRRAEDCAALLRDVHRVLKPGGRLYLIDYTARNTADTAARALQSALSTACRFLLLSPTVPHPIAQTLSRNDDDWETVWMQAWRRRQQPVLVQPETAEAVTGLQSLSPVVAAVCVKRRVSRLSAYVAQKDGVDVMDELLKFGTFRGGQSAEPERQQAAAAGGAGSGRNTTRRFSYWRLPLLVGVEGSGIVLTQRRVETGDCLHCGAAQPTAHCPHSSCALDLHRIIVTLPRRSQLPLAGLCPLLRLSAVIMSCRCSLLVFCLLVALPVVLCSSLPAGPRSSASADYRPFDATYELVWSDEFEQADGSAPDPAVWSHETGGNGEGNHELEYYTDHRNNSFIQDGRLVIQGLKEPYLKHNYTSARIDSAGKVEVLYGLLAARARIRMYDGFWPAFWLVGSAASRVDWPRCGEMDIMEQVNGRGTGGQDNSLQFGTLHYNQYGENASQVVHQSTGGIIKEKPGHYWGDEFHLYQALWTADSFTFMVDDLAYESIDLTSNVSYNSFTDSSNPFFFIVNLALGGDFPRRVPEDGFPARFELDWIRVWQQRGSDSRLRLNWADEADRGQDGDEAQSRKRRDLSAIRNRLKQRHEAARLIK